MEEKLIILGLAVVGMALIFLLFHLIRPRSRFPYERRELLTSNEFPFYRILQPLCEKHGWLLLIKMRLADIMAVRSGEKEYMSYFNKIKAKHTDFVLCDPDTLDVLCGVELDDPSHDRPDRIERDEFVDQVYETAGIPLLHVWMPIKAKELERQLLSLIPSLTDALEETFTEEDFPEEALPAEEIPAEVPEEEKKQEAEEEELPATQTTSEDI